MINPQNGHILEGPTSPRDVFVDKSFSSESVRKLRKLRRWARKECKTEPTLSRFSTGHDDTFKAAILCKIAQLTQKLSVLMVTVSRSGFGCAPKVSNSDQLLFQAWAIIKPETSTSSLSFRSSELSQPI